MNFFANILRKIGFHALILLIPLCLAPQAQKGFAESCESKAESAEVEISVVLTVRCVRKIQPRFVMCMHPTLISDHGPRRIPTPPPQDRPLPTRASLSLPMLC